jgi:hypothetical protein
MEREDMIEEIMELEEILPVIRFCFFELKTWNERELTKHLVTLEEKIA